MMNPPHDAATVERLVGIARRYAASEQDNHRAVRLLLLAAQAEVGVELPYGDGEALVESARIIMAPGENGAGPAERRGRQPLTLRLLLEGDPPKPPEMHTDQFILAGDINDLGGGGDAGKTTTLFHVAVCTPIARSVFGSLTVRKPGAVVLVVPEDGAAVARHHIDALMAGMDPPLTDEERAILARDLHIVGEERPVNLLKDTGELADLIADIKPTLVICEPIASLIGGEDENAEAVAHAVCDNLRRDIARPFGAAVMLAGHLRKPGREGGEAVTVHDLKGSAGWANHARIVWLVSKPKGGSTITYRLAKSNRIQTGIEHQATLAIEANPDNAAHWLTAKLTDVNLGTSSQSFTPGVGRAINDNERRALDALDDRHEPGQRLSYSAWMERSGIASKSTFKDVRGRLIDAGLAEASPTGRKTRTGAPEYCYIITNDGRQTLDGGWKHAAKG
jgi:hypothetical protein